MESDSESRSNSSVKSLTRSPKNNQDSNNDIKESNSGDDSIENDLHPNSVPKADNNECDSMAVDEDGELQNGSKDVAEFQHKEAKRKSSHPTKITSQRSAKRDSADSSASIEPDSTGGTSSSCPTQSEDYKVSTDEKLSVDSDILGLDASSTTDADSNASDKREKLEAGDSTKDSNEEEEDSKMEVDADADTENENHVGSSEDVDPSSSFEPKSTQADADDELKLDIKTSDSQDDTKTKDVPEDKPVIKQEVPDNNGHVEPAEKTNPKEKGIGIDAIAKKLGLQVNNENLKDSIKEESEESKNLDTKDFVESASPDTKIKVAPEEKVEVKSEKKKKKKRNCEECNAAKGLRFQVLFQNKMRFFCCDDCLKTFKEKHKTTTIAPATPPPSPVVVPVGPPTPVAPVRPPTPVEVKVSVTDSCAQCKKVMKDGKGYYPMIGAIKPLCSTDCLVTYQEYNIPKKKCSQCKNIMEDETSSLSWETMEFCNEDCLGKFQSFLGSHCTCCQSPVQQTSLGKYCVCFGADIRQFCSGSCLGEFKKGLKVCSYCQRDLSTNTEGFLAPVGDKSMFKDFCSPLCMEGYEYMYARNNAPPRTENCGYCTKSGIFKIHVLHEGVDAGLCCDNCVSGYRYVQKISLKVCDTCYKFFGTESDRDFHLQFEGVNKFFCTRACMTLFMLSNRKIIPCSWCKVKKYNFDMIEKLDSSHQMQTYCSLNCISLFRVSLSATSAKSIRCDNCTKTLPAQFHLTMSDGSIRNFCAYVCVTQFQKQFTNAPTLTTSTAAATRPTSTTTQSTVVKTTSSGMTPVISSVVSLATGSPRPQNLGIAKIVNPPKGVTATATRTSHPSITILTAKSPTISPALMASSSSSTTNATSSTTGSQVLREVIVKPPQPKSVKNKAVLCKPIMQTKGISCKPHPCHKAVQTDEGRFPIIVPVPVPVYIPTPVHMFSRPVPCPVPFPIPIPVPIFIPLSKDSPTRVIKQLKDLKEKVSTSPYEADLLMMAQMVADNEEKKDQDKSPLAAKEGESSGKMAEEGTSQAEEIVQLDVEAESTPGISPVLQKETENLGDDVEYLPKDRYGKRSASGRGRGRGKRARVDIISLEEAESYPTMPLIDDPTALPAESSDASLRLKHTFGVNAWKHWVLHKNAQLEKGSQSSRKFKMFKTDLLQLPHDELNYSLCMFVQEVRKPNGEEYAPASVYYLCLGVQQYLFENGRIDNIFTDTYYEKFTDCLNDVLLNQVELMSAEGFFISRIEEEVLWESKQLGAHSPHVLLNTLMFFNTKYFDLKAIDDHMHLSFSHITKHWRKTSLKSGPRNVVLRYYPPQNKEWQRRRKDENAVYEQNESLENPLRCPVKLYEFYLSKCPESVKTRNDVFYLYPERSCVPDSPVWYSTQPLAREMISKMLQRIKAVREIYET